MRSGRGEMMYFSGTTYSGEVHQCLFGCFVLTGRDSGFWICAKEKEQCKVLQVRCTKESLRRIFDMVVVQLLTRITPNMKVLCQRSIQE